MSASRNFDRSSSTLGTDSVTLPQLALPTHNLNAKDIFSQSFASTTPTLTPLSNSEAMDMSTEGHTSSYDSSSSSSSRSIGNNNNDSNKKKNTASSNNNSNNSSGLVAPDPASEIASRHQIQVGELGDPLGREIESPTRPKRSSMDLDREMDSPSEFVCGTSPKPSVDLSGTSSCVRLTTVTPFRLPSKIGAKASSLWVDASITETWTKLSSVFRPKLPSSLTSANVSDADLLIRKGFFPSLLRGSLTLAVAHAAADLYSCF